MVQVKQPQLDPFSQKVANFNKTIDKLHKTRLGYLVFGLVELTAAYGAALWALDSGSLWVWILAVITLIGFLRNTFCFIGTFFNKLKPGRTAN